MSEILERQYEWIDDPTVSGVSPCDTDVLNDCLMHLKYENTSAGVSNMYMTGGVETNGTGLNQLKQMSHSTFDLSKFTIVGSPKITDDGIATGFSSSDYVTIDNYQYIGSASTWDMTIKGTLPYSGDYGRTVVGDSYNVTTASNIFLGRANNTGNIFFMVVVDNNGTPEALSTNDSFNNSLNGVEYICHIVFTGTQYKAIFNFVNGTTKTLTIDSTLKIADTNNDLVIGRNRNATAPVEFDLKEISIIADGVEVFSGHKTGIDTIKPDDYTVVGTPTISADGVASGFSGSNYLSVPMPNLSQANSWEIIAKFSINEFYNIYTPIFASSTNNQVIAVTVDNNSKLAGAIGNSNGTTWQINELGDWVGTKATIQFNKAYWVKLVFTGTQYKILISENGQDYTETVYYNSTQKVSYNSSYNFNIGHARSFTSDDHIEGSIDINAFKIYIDGNLVYQPCLKIPYTEAKTGSKIVDSIYRDRVNDMAEQFGYAPYYTLSDTDFTLPAGEIYGMIERKGALTASAPDYSNPVSLTPVNNMTIENSGWLEVQVQSSLASASPFVSINGAIVCRTSVNSNGDLNRDTALVMVSAGDVITIPDLSDTAVVLTYFPFKN